jgi:hypothetical protein
VNGSAVDDVVVIRLVDIRIDRRTNALCDFGIVDYVC